MKILNIDLPESGLVFLAARPWHGKSFTAMKMADELISLSKKPLFAYIDGFSTHEIYSYRNGKTISSSPAIDIFKKRFPNVPFIIDDIAARMRSERWQDFVSDIMTNLKPDVLFINRFPENTAKEQTRIIENLKNTALSNGVLFVVETGIKRGAARTPVKRPSKENLKCPKQCTALADRVVFVYNDFTGDVEIYTDDGQKSFYEYENII